MRVHECKEIENYLLCTPAISRAVEARLAERSRRTGIARPSTPDIAALLDTICSHMKNEVLAQFLARQGDYFRHKEPHLDQATINKRGIPEFERRWSDPELRLRLVPGKDVLAQLNDALQEQCDVSISDLQIASQIKNSDMPADLRQLLQAIEAFRKASPEGLDQPTYSVDTAHQPQTTHS